MAKIECTEYLAGKVEDMQSLIEMLSEYYDGVSILGCDTKGKKVLLINDDINIEDYEHNEQGFVVRILQDGRYFEYSFNQFQNLDDVYDQVMEAYRADRKMYESMQFSSLDEIACDKSMTYEDNITEVDLTYEDISLEEVISKLTKLKKKAKEKHPEIRNITLLFTNVQVSKVFISSTKQLSQAFMFSEIGCDVLCERNGKIASEHGIESGMEGLEILEKAPKLIEEVCKNSVDMLESSPIEPGYYDIICTPEVSGLIAHEAFGHGVEMDMFVKKRSLALDYMGERVGSDLVTMIDGSRQVSHEGSYLFDDEGNLGTDTLLINRGILVAGINDQASSKRLNKHPTGNGRRESFERKAYSRMTNTYFEAGKDQLEDMIASIDYGFLLEGCLGGMEDPKHWGIQCILSRAREIKNGKFTGKLFGPVILTGYVPDLLKSISMVSNDVKLFGGGYCGKGYKEFIKVSDGGPYIKAKARLG